MGRLEEIFEDDYLRGSSQTPLVVEKYIIEGL